MFVCGHSVCVRVCDYAAKPLCVASYSLGAAPNKPLVKQHSDTGHSANVVQVVCRYLLIVCRGLTPRDRFGMSTRTLEPESDHNS